ncbi:hypothetical protein D3C87_1706830 [compost metagenome]
MAGLMRQGFIFALQVRLPGFEFIQQSIEVVTEVVEFDNVRRWHALIERSLATSCMGDSGQVAQWLGDPAKLSARQKQRNPGTDSRA